MKTTKKIFRIFLAIAITFAIQNLRAQSPITPIKEGFEAANKSTYKKETVTLGTGSWLFDDALIGNNTADHKMDAHAMRIQNNGSLTMQFDVENIAETINISYAVYGNDAESGWQLWYSNDRGNTWTKASDKIVAYTSTITKANFSLHLQPPVRFQVRKLDGGRMNIDDITIAQTEPVHNSTRDDNLSLGNPSNATTDATNANNFLVVKPQYSLSYNNETGTANWVCWHLSSSWKGSAKRCDCFTSDNTLPAGFFKASTGNYTSTGFDRGHLCPSDDRDACDSDNKATFLMDNIIPQAPKLNEQTWKALEDYCRSLVLDGNELYIISGGYGSGGTGSKGATKKIANHINVPAHCWKIIVVLPNGNNDVQRVNSNTRVIAVDMPNTQDVTVQPWQYYRTSVNNLENITGYNFLSNVPLAVQKMIEGKVDDGKVN